MSIAVPLRQRLKEALVLAMKNRDRLASGTLRATIAAIDNAEAVDTTGLVTGPLAIEQSPLGVGAAEADRRVLSEQQIEQIVRTELAERRAAADQYDHVGKADRAERLRAEAAILATVLVD